MSTDLVLGVDVGTSALKVLVWRPGGESVARGSATYQVNHPHPGWTEQDPDQWWRAMATATRSAVSAAGVDPRNIRALALSTQGGTLVPVDAAGNPVRPAVIWSDTRCARERLDVVAEAGERLVYETCGWTLGQALNLLQLRWLRRNEPQVFAHTAQFLSVPDFLAMRLTGRPALDPSNAGVNQLASVLTGRWSDDLLALAGIEADRLGEIIPAGDVVGALRSDAADHLGLEPGIPVINGGHDQYCVALGCGVVEPGDVFIGSGTAWVTAGIRAEPHFDFERGTSISRHVIPGLFGELASLESGGAALEWWRRLMAKDGALPSWPELSAGVSGKTGLAPLFLPYMKGCPFPRPVHDAPGVIWGLDPAHDAFDLAASVMAGVAFQTAWALQAIAAARPACFSGGAARNTWWTQFMADVSPVPIRVVPEPDAGALGAAMLAASGAGLASLADAPQASAGHVVTPGPLAESRRDGLHRYVEVATAVLSASHSMRRSPA